MLQAAQRQRQLGRDVRVGVVETHGRAETEAMRVGLAEQPMRRSEYRGVTLFEMDLDGLLQAQPSLALVDELAHSNAPGQPACKTLAGCP
jgi:two-component system, OmpR family, sensor histidine kinase KdpD